MNNQGDVQSKDEKVNAIGDNNTLEEPNREVNMETNTVNFDPYIDAPLSGACDHINSPDQLDDLLSMFLVKHNMNIRLAPSNSVLEFPRFTENICPVSPVKECAVSLKPLSHIDMEVWLKPNDILNKEGYNLRQPKSNVDVPVQNKFKSRYGREVKSIVNLENQSDSSQDEDDPPVMPGHWSQPRQHNIHVPSVSGPSTSRLHAQKLMQKQNE